MVSTIFDGAKKFKEEDGTIRDLMRDASHYVPEGYLRAGMEAGVNAGIYNISNKLTKPILLNYSILIREDNNSYERTIDEYIKTLPYPSCFYNPQFKKSVFVELCVNDYLKRLGFESIGGYSGSQTFVLQGYNPFKKGEDYITLSFKVIDDTTNGMVSMVNGSLNWMEVSFTNLDEAIGAINSLVKPVLLSSVAFSINKFDNISDMMSNLNGAEDNTIDVKTAKVYVSDAKEKVIKMLEDTLKMLKGE